MIPLSLSDIYKLEYDDQGIGEYRWTHPALITGFNKQYARAFLVWRDLERVHDLTWLQDEFEETPDTLITDYLGRCLRERRSCIKKGSPLPSHLNITPLEYIDAVLYLITDLGSSYACHILGATNFHNDDFLTPQDARPILERLKIAQQESSDVMTADLVRTLTLEIFHLGYPWDSDIPRFDEVLTGEDKVYLERLLQQEPPFRY